MKRIMLSGITIFFAISLWPALSVAQTHSPAPRAEGMLKGFVLDPRNSRVVDAKITLENKTYRFEAWSNDEGAFEVRLPAGKYTLTVEGNGFQPYIKKGVRIEADKTETISVTVVIAAPPDDLRLKKG
jgi:hypothetical protein